MAPRGEDMYKSSEDLPDNLKDLLPPHAQHIYMKSHNRAMWQYADPKNRKYGGTQEEAAHRVAWSAVKSKYEKDDNTGKWRPKEGVEEPYEPEYEENPDVKNIL